MSGRRGFTLLEVIVVIAVISILAAMAAPYVAGMIDQSRRESTRKEMQALHEAIVGDPQGPTAGFAGDMGRLPADLSQLNTRGAQPARTYGTLGVKFGWDGPYMNAGFDPSAHLSDAWGTAYRYGIAPDQPGMIRSAGPDRNFGTADDIVFPQGRTILTGRLLLNLYVWSASANQFVLNPRPAAYPGMSATVTIWYSNNGTRTAWTIASPPSDPPFSPAFNMGFREVFASCTFPGNPGPVSGRAVVYVPGNNQQAQLNLYLR